MSIDLSPTILIIKSGDEAALHAHLKVNALDPTTWKYLLSDAVGVSMGMLQAMLEYAPRKPVGTAALAVAGAAGRLDMMELMLPHCLPRYGDSHALRVVAHSYQPEILAWLIPLSNPKSRQSEALRWAAMYGDLASVRLLLPVSDARAKRSVALQWAAERGHAAIVELLWPHSDVTELTKKLFKSRRWKYLDALAIGAPAAILEEWVTRAPAGVLPLAGVRLQACHRQARAIEAGAALGAERQRPRS